MTPAALAMLATLYVGDPSQWGHVTHLVEPGYPQRALAEGRTGHVDVRGRVNAHGILGNATYSPGDPGSGIFIDPLRRVIRQWRFEPPLGPDCQPSAQRVANRVWFRIEEGKPRIAVAVLPDASRAHGTIAPLKREEPAARAAGETVVYARMHVDNQGGVVSVEPRSYTRGRAGAGVRALEHEVIRALTQWRFPPAQDAQRRVCHSVRPR